MPAAPETPNEPGPRTLIAPRPLSVIPRGLFTINFLVQLLIWKYVVGVPLHRLRKVWASQGVHIAAGSLVGTLKPLVEILEPLYQAIMELNRQEPWWHADETHWKVFIEYVGKVGHRWWLWVFKGPHSTVFILSPTRSAKVPKDHLQRGIPLETEAREEKPLDRDNTPASQQPETPETNHHPPWWGKRLLTDFYGAYRAMLDGILHAWCWAHVRRHFIKVGKAVPALEAWSQQWVERIAELYQRNDTRGAAPDGDAWHAADQALRAWVQTLADTWRHELADPALAPQARKVLATVERQWEGLTLFLDYPEMPLDNNEALRHEGPRREWARRLEA